MQRIARITINRLSTKSFSLRSTNVGSLFESSRITNMTNDYFNEYGIHSDKILRSDGISLPLSSLTSSEMSFQHIIDSTEEIMKLTSR